MEAMFRLQPAPRTAGAGGGAGWGNARPYLRPAADPLNRSMSSPDASNNNRRMMIPLPPVAPFPIEFPAGGWAQYGGAFAVHNYSNFRVEKNCGRSSITICTTGSLGPYAIGAGGPGCVQSVLDPCASISGPYFADFPSAAASLAGSFIGSRISLARTPGLSNTLMNPITHWRRVTAGAAVDLGKAALPLPDWPLPWSLPAGSADVGWEAMPVPSPLRNPSPARDPDGRPYARPYVRPASGWSLAPRFNPDGSVNPRPRSRPRPVEHKEVPDDADKARKVPAAMMAALKLFHDATEMRDAVDAVYKSLSDYRKKRCGRPSGVGGRFVCVVNNWDAFTTDPGAADNIQRAINNLLSENVNDRAVGKLFGSHWKGLPGGDRGGSQHTGLNSVTMSSMR